MQPTVIIKKELLDAADIKYFPSDQSFLNQVTKALLKKSNNNIITEASKPDLKPNPNLGEGVASDEETKS